MLPNHTGNGALHTANTGIDLEGHCCLTCVVRGLISLCLMQTCHDYLDLTVTLM